MFRFVRETVNYESSCWHGDDTGADGVHDAERAEIADKEIGQLIAQQFRLRRCAGKHLRGSEVGVNVSACLMVDVMHFDQCV